MSKPAPIPEKPGGWRPGALIGMGTGLLCCTGPAFLWLALWGLPDDPAGILRRGLWLGPTCMAFGAALAAWGYIWLRRSAQSGSIGRGFWPSAIAGAVWTSLPKPLLSHWGWLDGAGLAASLLFVAVLWRWLQKPSSRIAEPVYGSNCHGGVEEAQRPHVYGTNCQGGVEEAQRPQRSRDEG
jgi:hypothetical protein